MLAGLIFAIEEASDRPGSLVATLPFGATSLLEHQVRLLDAAGAEQVLIAVGRMTPALLAAVNRAAQRDIAVDMVRSAEEAAERLPDGARIVVMADGMVTSEPVVARLAAEGAQALLVTEDAQSPAAIERLDMRWCWAGLARITLPQLAEIAHMPEDYDFQSALLRVAAQSGAELVPLTPGWARAGHAVERTAEGLASRSTGVIAAITDRRHDWADRWLFTPVARRLLPELVSRALPGWGVSAAAGLVGAGAVGAIVAGYAGAGALVALLAVLLLTLGAGLAALRGEEQRAAAHEWAQLGLAAAVALALAHAGWRGGQGVAPLVLALVAVGAQWLVERVPVAPRRWWSSAGAQLVLLAPFALVGHAALGLALVALYTFVTLGAAVEGLREKA